MPANMRHYLGLSESALGQGRETIVLYEPHRNINAHALLCGISGTGKSFQSQRLLQSAAAAGLAVDVIDPHEELGDIRGGMAVKYSQATGYGYNPLALDTDIHVGGVERQIDQFIQLVKDVTPGLGSRQRIVLRHLMRDTYAEAGISQDNPATWHRGHITEVLRLMLIESKRYLELRKYYPTLDDMRALGERKLTAMMIGSDNPTVLAYSEMRKLLSRRESLITKHGKLSKNEDIIKSNEQITLTVEKAKTAFAEFVNSHQNGKELDDLYKYDSVEVLKSVLDRIELLAASGTFRSNPPPFEGRSVKIHQIKALTDEQKIMFVKLRLREIFDRLKKLGPTESGTELRHIVFIDEAHKFFNDRPDDIINVVAKEARKFGLGLWCASQQPTEFPDSFLTNCGAIFLLGIASKYWGPCIRELRIKESDLINIKPKQVIAVKMIRDGQTDPSFDLVAVPNPETQAGRRASMKLAPGKAA
jgi:hypothetical protein